MPANGSRPNRPRPTSTSIASARSSRPSSRPHVEGDFDALVAVLHPEVILRSDGGTARPSANHVIRGAAEVASRAQTFAHLAPFVRQVLVNGVPGVVVAPQGRPFSVLAFTVAGGQIAAIDALADPDRLERLELGA